MNRPKLHSPKAITPVRDMFENFLDTQLAQGKQFEVGQLIQCSWMWFKVGGNSQAQEILAPKLGLMPMEFTPDCSEALNLVATQRYICDSFGVEWQGCNARQSVLAIKDIEHCKEIFMTREGNEDQHISGWFFGAQDSQLDANNPDHLEQRSAWELTCLWPQVLEFFLLPSNWQVVFESKPVVLKDYEPVPAQKDSYFAKKYGIT